MTARAERRDNVADLIFDMDLGVGNLVKWGILVRDLGIADGTIEPEGLYVLGEALLEQARAVQEEWRICFDLTRPMREGGR